MSKYLLGLDNGGTAIKAVIFDTKGQVLAHSSERSPVQVPEPGYMERDMEELWQSNVRCIRDAVRQANVEAKAIVAIAISGHGKGLYLWGKDGKPAYRGIASTDNRAWKYLQEWQKDGTFERNYGKLCQKLMAGQPLALLAWMKSERADVYENIKWIFSIKDYIRYRLTGEAWSEVTDLSGSGLLNVRDACLDQAMLDDFGLGELSRCIPHIKQSTDCCGMVTESVAALTGLDTNTIVAAGLFDIDACALAMSVLSPDDMACIAGTWSINEYISKLPLLNTDPVMMNSLYAVPGYYLIEECSATSAGNLEWFVDQFKLSDEVQGGETVYERIEKEIKECDIESNVYFLPFLYCSNTHPFGKAAIVGLTAYHKRSDILRAVFEGVVFSHKLHIDRLLKNREKPEAIRLAGGVCNSGLWSQMFADILDFPIETVRVKELGALGAAMAAGVCVGIFPDYQTAASEMVQVDARFIPNKKTREIYKNRYEKYLKICEVLNLVWAIPPP